MANFFKDYQAEIRRKREQERAEELRKTQAERDRAAYLDGLERGDPVRFSVLVYSGTETPANVQRLYFVANIGGGHCLLADTKKQAMTGRGSIYATHGILTK